MIVCADDFGLADDINRAVIDLAERGRISAVSCMVALEGFDRDAFSRLLKLSDRLDIGLHLTLTDIAPVHPVAGVASLVHSTGSFVSMGQLFRKGLCGRLDPSDVAREAGAQFERFTAFAGRPPDYLDSHLHVHQFAGVREGVLQFFATLDPETAPYIRNTAMTLRKIIRQGVSPLKCYAIGQSGRAFQRAVRKRGWKTNGGFAGVYAYDGYTSYPDHLERFVVNMEGEDGILMTHPGEVESWRRIEYETLRDAGILAGRVDRFRR